MNLYIRYFNSEVVVHSLDEAIDFLNSIDEIQIDEHTIQDINAFMNSDERYPKRYKVKARVYFIVIKTEANTIEEFKEKKTVAPAELVSEQQSQSETPNETPQEEEGNMQQAIEMPAYQPTMKELREREQQDLLMRLNEPNEGWYEAMINFKRVVTIPSTGKHEYRDTVFSAYLKASSGKDCYDRIVEYASSRVDARSQFPSIKGRNYIFRYIGKAKELKGVES